jgi:transposase
VSKTRRTYTREFKIDAVRLLETSGKSASQIERELGIGKGNLGRWKGKYGTNSEQAESGSSDQALAQARIRELERENEILRQERDILKKAVAIFSQPKQ